MAWERENGRGRRLLAAGLIALGLLGRRLPVHSRTPGIAGVNRAGTPEAVSVTAATFRRVAEQDTGTIHLRFRNPTGRTLRTSTLRVNGVPVDLAGRVGNSAQHHENLELLGDAGP